MMHHMPWMHPQAALDMHMVPSYHPNNHEQHHGIEEESEHTGDETHDTMTSATSGERSSSTDLFGLMFAAAQWSKLVSNAEGLFNKLMTSNILTHTEQDQIEQWLCMKQEYEECIATDTASLYGYMENAGRSLERIEEVTETEDKTDESTPQTGLKIDMHCTSSSVSESSDAEEDDEEEEEEDEDQSDNNSDNPDFLEKLHECMNKFKLETDGIIDSKKDDFQENNIIIPTITKSINANNNYVPLARPIPRNPNSRRNSMLPGSEMCNEVLAFNSTLKPNQNQLFDDTTLKLDNEILDNHKRYNDLNETSTTDHNDNSPDLLIDALRTTDTSEPIQELKTLTMNKEAKQMQVRKIELDYDDAHKRIEELESMIEIKEQFIAEMLKNADALANARQKFQRSAISSKMDDEYCNSRAQLTAIENTSEKDLAVKSAHEKEIELYKNIAIHYEKKLMDIEMIKQVAGDSAKKVLELESSLNTSRKQMEKLKRQLKKEEERKTQLEEELAEDQKKIRELEEKYNVTASKLKDIQGDKAKTLMDVTARITHLNHVLKEKSLDIEKTEDTDEKEALRHEIRNLRRTRDCLVDEKCDLDEKLQKERNLSRVEKRKLLECGETIEAIDAMIEHKNEMICGRKGFDENQSQREKGERMLMERLAKLSDGEMRTLFYKYFLKVIDLKESSKNLEVQTAELENHMEAQERRIQALTSALEQTKLEADRRLALMQRDHTENLHVMFKHFADATGGAGHDRLDKDSELAKYKRENRTLRKRLADVEALLKGPSVLRTASPVRIPQQELKQIAPSSRPTTKVTRQRNKLIIQKTTDCDKKKK